MSDLEQRTTTRVWLIRREDITIGFSYAQGVRFGTAEIGMTILPAWRQIGYGMAAHRLLVAQLKAEGVRTLSAISQRENLAEVQILRHLGFLESGRVPAPNLPESRYPVAFRCDLRSPLTESFVFILTGSAGVGKSMLSEVLRGRIKSAPTPNTVRFLWGDMFSHISYPWTADTEQLDLKYDIMAATLSSLIDCHTTIVIDDLFRRNRDLNRIIRVAIQSGAAIIPVMLTAPLAVVLERNRGRYSKEVLPDERVSLLYDQVREAAAGLPSMTEVENLGEADAVVEKILAIDPVRLALQ